MITLFTSDDMNGSIAAVLAHVTAKNVHGSVCVKRFGSGQELVEAFNSFASVLQAGAEELAEVPKHPGEVWVCRNGLELPPSEFEHLPDFIGVTDKQNPFDLLLRLTYDRRVPLKSCLCNFVLDSKADNKVRSNIERVYNMLDPENFEILMAYMLSEFEGDRFDPIDNFAIRIFVEQMETDNKILQEAWSQ